MNTNFHKGIAPLLIVAIVAGVMILGTVTYYSGRDYAPPPAATPLPETPGTPVRPSASIDTSSWLTYKNGEAGIEFKYPAAFTLTELNTNEAHFAAGRFAVVELEGQEGVTLKVYVDEKKEWVEACYNDPNFNDKTKKPETINGVQYFTHSYSDAAMGGARSRNIDYRTVAGGKCFGIDTAIRYREAASFKEYPSEDDRTRALEIERLKNTTLIQENSALLEKIVSTFTISASAAAPREENGAPFIVGNFSTWKTFTNETRAFSFKYPPELSFRSSPGGNSYLATFSVDETGRLPKTNELTFRITVIQMPPPFPGSTMEATSGLAPWYASLESSLILEDVQETTFAGVPAIIVGRETPKENPRGALPVTSIRFFRNGVRYQITYAPADSDLKEVAEQMLSTFTFIK